MEYSTNRLCFGLVNRNGFRLLTMNPMDLAGLLTFTTAIGINGYIICNKLINQPETYVGFESEQREGFKPVSYALPTQGDVVEVKKVPDETYETVILNDGHVVVSGRFAYKIRPQRRFAPKDEEHTDMHGNSPFLPLNGDNYWRDVRKGSVTLMPSRLEEKLK